MSENQSQSLDVLGIKPVGEAITTAVKGTVDGAAAFLSRICLPAAEEFGLLLRDRVSHLRAFGVGGHARGTDGRVHLAEAFPGEKEKRLVLANRTAQ